MKWKIGTSVNIMVVVIGITVKGLIVIMPMIGFIIIDLVVVFIGT